MFERLNSVLCLVVLAACGEANCTLSTLHDSRRSLLQAHRYQVLGSLWSTMSRTFDTLGNDTVDVVFDNLGLQVCGNLRGRSSSPSGIMQIVTSAVRINVALTLSRRRSLFAPPNLCGTLVVLAHADAQSLCAAVACSLSELWWLSGKRRRRSVA